MCAHKIIKTTVECSVLKNGLGSAKKIWNAFGNVDYNENIGHCIGFRTGCIIDGYKQGVWSTRRWYRDATTDKSDSYI